MPGRTFREHVIVVRKTRLHEADLVLTLVAEDGRQVRAVAKGALKPAGTFASRLELYAESEVLLVEGRSLCIVKESRLVDAHAPLRFDYARSVCAAPMAEFLSHATQDNLPVARLFPLSQTAFSSLEGAGDALLPLCTVAFLLKASALLGFRPSLVQCAECGQPREVDAPGPPAAAVAFSFGAGGVLCADCAMRQGSVRPLPAGVVDWAEALIRSTFARIVSLEVDAATVRALVAFSRDWVQAHVVDLRSIPFVFELLR